MKRIRRTLDDQRVRFLIVGATNTAIGYAIYSVLTIWVFSAVPFGYLLSLAVSYAIAIVVAFVLYRRFVFIVEGHIVRDFLRFVSVYLTAIAFNAIALPVLVEFAHIPPVIAQAIVLVVTTLFSYFGHKLFSFHRHRRTDSAPPPVV